MRKDTIVLIVILSTIMLFTVLWVMLSGEKGEKGDKCKNKQCKEIETYSPDKDKDYQDPIYEDDYTILNDLKNNNDYKVLSNNDSLFYDKYQSLNYIIYTQNINSYSDLSDDLVKAAVFNNISESDISITYNKADEYTAYVKKEYVDQRIKTLFNNNVKVKVDYNSQENYDDYFFIKISDEMYKNITIIDLYKNKYQINITTEEYYYKEAPRTYPFPMKITNVKQFDEYILVESKAVYLQQGVFENNKWKLWVYDKANPAMTKDAKSLGEVYVNPELFCTVDINKYIDQASTIYTIFKKDGENYYFYKNYINN